MGGPIGEGQPGLHVNHGDAVVDRSDMHAEIAADAFRRDHLVAPAAVLAAQRGDRLMGRVLAGDVALAAPDAEVLVDGSDGLEVDVEMLPFDEVGYGGTEELPRDRKSTRLNSSH